MMRTLVKTEHRGKGRRMGIALGSGGARGWAHLGVITALDELGIRPEVITGSSIGALMGAMLATGKLSRMETLAGEMDWSQTARLFLEAGLPHSGLINGRHINRLLRDLLGDRRIESLPIPFSVVATDLRTEAEIDIDCGDLVEAIRASISLPGIFAPKQRGEKWLIDGGLVNPLPVQSNRALGADFVIAVEVNLKEGHESEVSEEGDLQSVELLQSLTPRMTSYFIRLQRRLFGGCTCWGKMKLKNYLRKLQDEPNIFEVLTRTLRIAENSITRLRLKTDPPDLLIQPRVSHIGTLEFHRARETIEAGRRVVMENEIIRDLSKRF